MARAQLPDPRLAEALYDAMFPVESWIPYADSEAVLSGLRERAVKVAVVSNIAHDLRPTFEHWGLAPLVDAFVFSYEVGAMKPEPKIFHTACEQLGVAPERALMVGDTLADAGAIGVGMVSLGLPASPPGQPHGLGAVLALVDATGTHLK